MVSLSNHGLEAAARPSTLGTSTRAGGAQGEGRLCGVGCNSEAYCTVVMLSALNGAIRLAPIAPYSRFNPVVSLSNHGSEDAARPSTGLRTGKACAAEGTTGADRLGASIAYPHQC